MVKSKEATKEAAEEKNITTLYPQENPNAGPLSDKIPQKKTKTQAQQSQQVQTEKQRFLFECMKENLVHARHVENERLTFISLLLVSTGMILNFSANIGNPLIKLLMGVALLLFNVICTKLLGRWNAVFEGHRKIAEKIMNELEAAYEKDELPELPPVIELGAQNRMYYFDNRNGMKGMKIIKQKNGYGRSDKKKQAPYFGTKTLFYIFNAGVYLVLTIFFINLFFPSLSFPALLSRVPFLF